MLKCKTEIFNSNHLGNHSSDSHSFFFLKIKYIAGPVLTFIQHPYGYNMLLNSISQFSHYMNFFSSRKTNNLFAHLNGCHWLHYLQL